MIIICKYPILLPFYKFRLSSFKITIQAWIIPGTKNRHHRPRLSKNCNPQPRSNNTARNEKLQANIISKMNRIVFQRDIFLLGSWFGFCLEWWNWLIQSKIICFVIENIVFNWNVSFSWLTSHANKCQIEIDFFPLLNESRQDGMK